MKLTEKEQAELLECGMACDKKSIDRFAELLEKINSPSGSGVTYSRATRGTVRESIKRAFPEYTEAQIDIFLKGRVGGWDLRESESPDYWPHHIEALAAAVKSLHPNLNDQEIAQWVKTHEERALAAKGKDAAKSDPSIVMALDGEDKAKADEQWLQDGLKKLHPHWSQSQIDEWVKKNETAARSFKGLHPEGDAEAIIRATTPEEFK